MMTDFAKDPVCFRLLQGRIRLRGIFLNLLSCWSVWRPRISLTEAVPSGTYNEWTRIQGNCWLDPETNRLLLCWSCATSICSISHPLGCSVWFSNDHVFLTREPQGFLWPCQTLVSTSGYEWRSIEPSCCWQTYYDPKGTNNSMKQIKYKAERRDGRK